MQLVSNTSAGTDLALLRFDAPAEGHAHFGQFVTAGTGDHKPSFFALANRPGEPVELLLKLSPGSTAEALAALPVGSDVEISAAMGNGFPLDRATGRPLVVLVNGSGISAVRGLLHAEAAKGDRPVHLFYGVMSPAHLSFADELEQWATAGVQVVTVLDASDTSEHDAPRGFVQDIALARGLFHDAASLVLVGHRAMCDDARAKWLAAGAPEEQVLLNF